MKEELIEEIKEYILYGRRLDIILKKNPNIYIDYLNRIKYDYYWFEFKNERDKEKDFLFIGEPFIKEVVSDKNEEFYVFISDFRFNGILGYSINNPEHKEFKIPVNLNASIKIFKFKDKRIPDYVIRPEYNHFEIMDNDQKNIWLHHYLLLKELPHLFQDDFDITSHIKNSSKIDHADQKSDIQQHVNSFDFLNELYETNARSKYLFSNVLLFSKYANKYNKIEKELYFDNTEKYYESHGNFTYYDRMYLTYCELAIENLYKFWERIAFYLFQFFKPANGKVQEKTLSLYKLIKELKEDLQINIALKSTEFDWFVKNILQDKSRFKKLTDYRHPLIHYHYNIKRSKGSLIASTLNYWNLNIHNKNKIIELKEENIKIKDFIEDQLSFCLEGYENAKDLVGKLPDTNSKMIKI